MDNDDWSNEINGFVNSAMGKEIMRSLKEDLHDNLIRQAQEAKTADSAFGLLKEAAGVIKVLDHVRFLSVNVPRDVGIRD
ncbi:hypothetical protein H0W80_01085 [Candidatus Saccharibacteria bacterium]|nr:hypothetical protein [Candidatus Saccharibacteria bacterium]